MASKFFVGNGTNWSSTASWSTTSGGTSGAAVPTSADNVFLDGNSPGNLTIDVAAACNSLICTGFTHTLTHNGGLTLSIGSSTPGPSNVAANLPAGMTYARTTGSEQFAFVSTSSTQQTVTLQATATLNWGNITFSGAGGNWTLSNAFTSAGTLTLTAGTLTTNNQNFQFAAGVHITGSTTRSLTLGTSTLTITSASATWDASTTTNLTFSGASSTITMSNTTASFLGASLSYGTVNLTGSGQAAISGTFTAVNFNRTATAVKTDSLVVNNNFTVTGTLTLAGNSVLNRLLVFTNIAGTQRTITAAAVALSNVDMQDIVGAGAATWTGTSMGDCLGNSNITFDAPVAQSATQSGSISWSALAWTSRVPLPQDDVTLNLASGLITMDMPRVGRNIDLSGSTGGSFSTAITISSFGNLKLSTTSVSFPGGGGSYNLQGRGAQTIQMNGTSVAANLISVIAPGGSYTQLDDATYVRGFSLVAGTYDANNHNFTNSPGVFANGVNTTSPNNITRVLNMGTGTWTLANTGTNTTIWSINGINVTVNASQATIVVSNQSNAAMLFGGNPTTYGNLIITGGGGSQFSNTGANTFNKVSVLNGDTVINWGSATTVNITGTYTGVGAPTNSIYLPNVAGNYISTPNSTALQLSGAFTLDSKITLINWTPGVTTRLFDKSPSGNISYQLWIDTTGKINCQISVDGTTTIDHVSTVATGFAANSTNWVRVAVTMNTGSARSFRFYTSSDGVTWTQLGTTVGGTGLANVFASTAPLEIGSNTNGTISGGPCTYLRSRIFNTDLGSGSGTPVFDADFTQKPFGTNSFTESSSNAATVTINGNQAQAGDGRINHVSATSGVATSLSLPAQQEAFTCDWATFKDINASPILYAGANSQIISNCTNVQLSDRPGIMGQMVS